jgi:hypothetical protein
MTTPLSPAPGPTTPPAEAPAPGGQAAPDAPGGENTPRVQSSATSEAKGGTAVSAAKALALHSKAKSAKAQLAEQQAKLDADRTALAEQQTKLGQVAELQDLIARGEVVEAAKRLAGGDEGLEGFLQKLTDGVLASGKGSGLSKEDRQSLSLVRKLQDEIAALKKSNEERESTLAKTRQEYEAQQLEHHANVYLDTGWKELAKAPDEYELVLASDAYRVRVEERLFKDASARAQAAQGLGRKPQPLTVEDFKAAAKEVQEELEKELTPALSTKRIRQKLGVTENAPGGPVPGSRTVTTDGRGDPPISPDWEKLSVADRLYQFQLGRKPRV